MPFSCRSTRYVTDLDRMFLLRADEHTTYQHLVDIAYRILERMPKDVILVCGPITTGGFNSLQKNLERFAAAIRILDERGVNVFNQLVFEFAMKTIKQNPAHYKGGLHLLESFYRPLISSDRISTQCFLPMWNSSSGTYWEYDLGTKLNKKQLFFREDFEQRKLDESLFTEL